MPSSRLRNRLAALAAGAVLLLPCAAPAADAQPQCRAFELAGLYKQIELDLARYTEFPVDYQWVAANFCSTQYKRNCMRLRSVDGVMYVLDLIPGYQTRHKSTLHAVQRALTRLGPLPRDVEVTIDLSDGDLQRIDLPILMITHRVAEPVGILYPDFTFFNWPESACPPKEPTHANSWLMLMFAQNWTHEVQPWESRADSLFWRGGRVADGGAREEALQILKGAPRVDADFVTWRAYSSTGSNEVPGCVGLLEQCRYRFLPFLSGSTYSSRLKYQLLCGSTVLAVEPAFAEWWTRLLKAGREYALVAPRWQDAARVLAKLRAQPDEAGAIAQRGQELALTLLTPLAVDCYWWWLLASMAEILPPLGPLPPHARPLDDALLWPDDVVLTAELNGPVGGTKPVLVPPPRELHDPTCFLSDDVAWSRCCDTLRFGPSGDERCWEQDPTLSFDRCCLSVRSS